MAGTFSSQLKDNRNNVLTRTQRLNYLNQQKLNSNQFSEGQQEAQRLGTEVFVDKVREEKYSQEIPKIYIDSNGNISPAWTNKSDYQKKMILRNTPSVAKTTITKTRTYVNPFTAQEYSQEYSKLPSNVKQFFLSPEEIDVKQQQEKQSALSRINTKIAKLREKLAGEESSLQKFKVWWDRTQGSVEDYKQELAKYHRETKLIKKEIQFLESGKSEVDQGYSISSILANAESKADMLKLAGQQTDEERFDFEKKLSSGKLDSNLKTLNLTKQNVTFKKYNEKVDTIRLLQNKAEQFGYSYLTKEERVKLNPQAESWQEQYPTEVLQFDNKGNIVGVQSSSFGGTYNLKEYESKVKSAEEYNKELESKQVKQDLLIKEAQDLLLKNEFGKDVTLTKNKPKFFGKAWLGLKSIYLSSVLGTGYNRLSESSSEELTNLREDRTYETLTKTITPQSLNLTNLSKFGTIPIKTSYETLSTQRNLDYKAKEGQKLFEELDKISNETSEELKPYVQSEGMKIIEQKGVLMETKTTLGETDKFGNFATIQTTNVIDPAFERRVSQNMLQWETERKKKGLGGEFLLGTRIVSTKATETYLLSKGIMGGIKYGSVAYSKLGLPSLNLYKNVQLAEATARVPRDYKYVKTGFELGVTGLYGYGKYKQYQSYTATSEYGKGVFWLETSGQLIGLELATGIGRKSYYKVKNKIENLNRETLKQPDISQQGFLRENKRLGFDERVYMERYEGFKLSKPKTWLQSIKGYEKGQFIGRLDAKRIPDEVVAKYIYKGDVKLTYPSGEVRVIKAETFPFDDISTHQYWFQQGNIKEYGLGKYSELPVNIKNKALGFSASSNKFEINPLGNIHLRLASGEVVTLKGNPMYFSGKGASAGFFRIVPSNAYELSSEIIAKDPVLYASYFDKIQVNKAFGEMKGDLYSGNKLIQTDVKFPIFSKDTGQSGTLNLPMQKSEVEGVAEISERVIIRDKFKFKFGGWDIPIVEDVQATSLSKVDLKNIIKEVGSLKVVTASSYIPPPTSISKAVYSLLGYSKPSYPRTSSILSIPSSVSGISSSPSGVPSSVTSLSTSYPSVFSSPTSPTSIITSPTVSVPKVPSSIIFIKPKLPSIDFLKEKIRRKRVKTSEIKGLFPDFTTRILGLKPQKFKNVKSAIKGINQIQTGLEIRTGGKIISEKRLLKKLMK